MKNSVGQIQWILVFIVKVRPCQDILSGVTQRGGKFSLRMGVVMKNLIERADPGTPQHTATVWLAEAISPLMDVHHRLKITFMAVMMVIRLKFMDLYRASAENKPPPYSRLFYGNALLASFWSNLGCYPANYQNTEN